MNQSHQRRIVLLFDLDCFYAQCERVRLGLDTNVCLALLQWNSVLAVTYPAREKFGIKRGDTWENVYSKSKPKESNGGVGEGREEEPEKCWAIHLKILEKDEQGEKQSLAQPGEDRAAPMTTVSTSSTTKCNQPESQEHHHTTLSNNINGMINTDVGGDNNNDEQRWHSNRKDKEQEDIAVVDDDDDNDIDDADDDDDDDDNRIVKEEYDRIYKLSKEEQLHLQQVENGNRRFNHEGKACLERYRIASRRIFNIVLSSLNQRVGCKKTKGSEGGTTKNKTGGGGNLHTPNNFILERASIDEFYLDITSYCYDSHYNDDDDDDSATDDASTVDHRTIRVGEDDEKAKMMRYPSANRTSHAVDAIDQTAFERACRVAHWIRSDVYDKLGFTMSAGISCNKMMSKLTASYGKPNGQAMLQRHNFNYVLHQTKITKVRHFGGKLGHQIIQSNLFNGYNTNTNKDSPPTMGQLQSFSIPQIERALDCDTATTTAQFVFDSCRGIDHEPVKETMNALVKSITAFKTFPATSDWNVVRDWLDLMSKEIVHRVQKDYERNSRYPKTCTLNYLISPPPEAAGATTTANNKEFKKWWRNNRFAKSLRLTYPPPPPSSRASTISSASSSSLVTSNLTQGTHQNLNSNDTNKKRSLALIQQSLVEQSMEKLTKLVTQLQQSSRKKQHQYQSQSLPQQQQLREFVFRGVGLAALNFESRGKPPEGVQSIDSFFTVKALSANDSSSAPKSTTRTTSGLASAPRSSMTPYATTSSRRTHANQASTIFPVARTRPLPDLVETIDRSGNQPKNDGDDERQWTSAPPSAGSTSSLDQNKFEQFGDFDKSQQTDRCKYEPCSHVDSDMELAKKLQASYDRENYILSSVDQRRGKVSSRRSSGKGNANKKMKRIDTFFAKSKT